MAPNLEDAPRELGEIRFATVADHVEQFGGAFADSSFKWHAFDRVKGSDRPGLSAMCLTGRTNSHHG